MALFDGEAASESATAETAAKRAHDPAEPAIGVFKGISEKRVARSPTAASVQTTVRIRFGGCSGPSPTRLARAGSDAGHCEPDVERGGVPKVRPNEGTAA